MAAQRVVVIQDASREIISSAIKWAIDGLSLQPGDELTLLGVLHQVNNPSTYPFMGAGKLMGYKSRVDANSMCGANPQIINDEVIRKEAEYQNSTEILQIRELFEMKKIGFHTRVVAAPSPKVAALEAAKKLKATWIVLDRQMKKDKKYFMDRLYCGISRMKRNHSVELLRGPTTTRKNGEHGVRSRSSNVKDNEMLPGLDVQSGSFCVKSFEAIEETLDDEDLFSLEIFPTIRSTYNNRSNEDLRIDNGKGSPGSISVSSSFSASTSCEALSQLKEDDESSIAASNCETKNTESNEITIQKTEQEQINTAKEILMYSLSSRQLEGRVLSPVCFDCVDELPKMGLKRDFTYAELCAATNGFSTQNFLSEGGFGSVYKGRLTDGQPIAVKQHKHASSQGEKEFRAEVLVLNKASHKNVVKLLGSCSEGNHRLLVYEYVSNGSLNIHISRKNPNVLSWKNRINIAYGVARGLNYLHQNNIIHRDMRPNNILINHNYEPLLGDFGLAKTQYKEFDQSSDNKVVGTFGYLAPEYAESGRVSTKTDVYSFGVVMLELITGRTTMDDRLGKESLVGWARPLLKEKKYPYLIDERILDCHDIHELLWMVRVAEMCLFENPDKRPSMEKVEDILRCMMNGETVSAIEDFSLAHSWNSSLQKTTELQGEEETDRQKCASIDAASIRSEESEAYFTSLTQSTSRSLSTATTSESSFVGKRKSLKKRREKMRSQQVLYDEMLS